MAGGFLFPNPREAAKGLGQLGSRTDNMVGHLSPGEMVVPREMLQNKDFNSLLQSFYNAYGYDPNRFVVGDKANRFNQHTGAPEFAGDEMPEDQAYTYNYNPADFPGTDRKTLRHFAKFGMPVEVFSQYLNPVANPGERGDPVANYSKGDMKFFQKYGIPEEVYSQYSVIPGGWQSWAGVPVGSTPWDPAPGGGAAVPGGSGGVGSIPLGHPDDAKPLLRQALAGITQAAVGRGQREQVPFEGDPLTYGFGPTPAFFKYSDTNPAFSGISTIPGPGAGLGGGVGQLAGAGSFIGGGGDQADVAGFGAAENLGAGVNNEMGFMDALGKVAGFTGPQAIGNAISLMSTGKTMLEHVMEQMGFGGSGSGGGGFGGPAGNPGPAGGMAESQSADASAGTSGTDAGGSVGGPGGPDW